MSKRAKPVKKRKRTNWRRDWEDACAELIDCQDALSDSKAETQDARDTVIRLDGYLKRAHESATEECAELMRYRLICDWACQRIEKLEKSALGWDVCLLNCCNKWMQTALERSKEITKLQKERRILLDTLFEVQAENLMQGEDILRQRDELIKLRGEPAERISL